VARVGDQQIRRSRVQAVIDGLPPSVARQLSSPDRRRELLEKVVADELLWRKALKLDIPSRPDVRRALAEMERQVVISNFLENEVAAKVTVDESDLANFFAANRQRYQQAAAKSGEGDQAVTLEQVRPAVERDYRMQKMQSGYEQLVSEELATADVELFPERLGEESDDQ
jgi:hypothetical protein